MKKERNEWTMLALELLFFAAKLALAAGALIGALYVIGCVVEALSGFVSLGAGMLLLFAFIFGALYFDF